MCIAVTSADFFYLQPDFLEFLEANEHRLCIGEGEEEHGVQIIAKQRKRGTVEMFQRLIPTAWLSRRRAERV